MTAEVEKASNSMSKKKKKKSNLSSPLLQT